MDQIIELDTHKREYQYGKSRIAPPRRGVLAGQGVRAFG